LGYLNLQDWKMTDNIAGVEIAGLDNERLKFGGLENDRLRFGRLEKDRLQIV